MSRRYSFPPIASPDAKILILGSMPGQASLDAQRYYAHPRNLFWPIMSRLLGFDVTLPYAERANLLQQFGVAMWDVLQSCQREGSLDSNIKDETPNDFSVFLNNHPHIHTIFFNGEKAATSFKRHVVMTPEIEALTQVRLPSTSPANASQTFTMKLDVWRQVAAALGQS